MRFSRRFKRTSFKRMIYITYFSNFIDLYTPPLANISSNDDDTSNNDTSNNDTSTGENVQITPPDSSETPDTNTLILGVAVEEVAPKTNLVLRDISELKSETEEIPKLAVVNDTTVIHVRGNEDDYRYENSGNTLILTSPDNQYRLANYDVLMFDGLNDNNRPIESKGAIASDYTQGSTSAIFKSCIRREMLGGDILDREPAILCSIIGTGN